MIGLNAALLLLLAAASFGLASVEAAFYLARRRRLSHVTHHNPRAELVNRYLEDPATLLMPIHMGTYTAHVGMTILLTATFFDHLQHWAMLVAFVAMLAYLLVFRLTLPYVLVRRNPERSLLLLLPAFDAYARALRPLVSALRERVGQDPAEQHVAWEDGTGPAPPEVPPAPVHEENERRLQDSLVRFSETQVREVMTPRPDIVAIAATADIAELRRLMRETKYSRIPVFGGDLDDIVGVVEVRDLLDHEGPDAASLKPLARPVFLVPETKRIADLLREMQQRRTTFAVAIDEYGGTAGLVSVEDIVEELVGEIKDEYDLEAEPISVEADGAVLVSGRANRDRVEEALEISLADIPDVDTAGGLVTAMFGRIPRPGESLEYGGLSVEVLDAERKRVNLVRFRRLAPRAEA